jgi:hypothetical protein
MKEHGLGLIKHEVIKQKFADSLGEYYKKINQRGLSDLVILSDEEFEAGMNRMKEEVDKGEQKDPILEMIDLFTFKNNAE